MANIPPASDAGDAATLPALGLRWAALRGMLGSPLIDAEDQRELRRELLQELKTVEQSMSRVAARSGLELSTKIDVLAQALRELSFPDGRNALDLLESIRADVATLVPRNPEKPTHLSRGPILQRPADSNPGVSSGPSASGGAS
ncbi:hypothetical protein ACFFJB_04360 [Camelimonas abortus]|uniref:Uncharacterized protein n=1 Tax=Camelimonas abortus TaxID=1017184 RepID=A0ABV7LFU6_9HYPH